MNNLLATFYTALNSLKLNKVRTALTILGVAIGIAAVTTIFSAGESMKQFMINEISSYGSDTIEVEVKVPATKQTSTDNAMGMAMGGMITTLKDSDRKEIQKLPNVDISYSGAIGQATVTYENINKTSMLMGTTAEFINMDVSEIIQGRYYSEEENNSASNVAVLGFTLAKKLFPEGDAIGKMVKVSKKKFKIIGVLKERGASIGFDWDNLLFLPLETLQKKIQGTDYVSFMFMSLVDPEQQYVTKAEIEDILRDRHDIDKPKDDDFAVLTMEEMNNMMSDITGGISLLLSAIAMISLIVGGVGIMNIMYVSVLERTYEIGLRKSVGATKMGILFQFLWEAIVVTTIGGIVGVILGTVFTYSMITLASYYGFNWDFIVHWNGIFIAISFSVIIGLIFGIYPAVKAAQMDPISAIRKE